MHEPSATPKLTLGQKTTFGLPSFAMNLSGALFGGWLTYFYLPPEDAGAGKIALVAASAFAVAQLVGRIVDAIADPLVGYWSDRSRNRLGRRLPFLLFGGPILAAAFLALWFPPFAPGSLANSTYLVATLCFYWFAFTLVVAPYFALIPEIAESSQERVHLSSSMAIFTVLGLAVGLGAVGSAQDNLPDGITLLGWHIPSGIQFMAVLAAVSLLFLFWAPLINIRERPYSEEKAVPKGLFKGLAIAFKNPAFRTYLAMAALIQMGLTMVIASIPYLATQILAAAPGESGLIPHEDGETWAGALQAVVVVLAALFIPLVNVLTARLGKRRLFVLSGIIMTVVLLLTPATALFPDPAIPAILLFVSLAFPVSAALVLPNAIYGDVVDFEAERTGVRREGTYTGATALLTKAGIGLAQASVVGLLALGNTRAEPLGIFLCFPAGAVFVAIGTWIFSKHPIDT
jgi:GPH family glycoside/pentoside/hexuronide:cation symporter